MRTPAPVPLDAPLDEAAPRYRAGERIGEGGMGIVTACRDGRIGRDVAMKTARDAAADEARFLREARIQGLLEHPSIVPVYDLGRDAGGALYFTMKRVRGVGLDEIIDKLRARDVDMCERFSRRKLLTAFSNVCLAVDFAHSRGVIHRDLKPANIMLGDFGEVYLLDWGVARAPGVVEPDRAPVAGHEAHDGSTTDGSLVGTPGYMSPEQARGEISTLDGRSDVYSLGAILFELLMLRPLHEGNTTAALLGSTLGGADAGASQRAPDAQVPPELESICARATALDPADRHPTARALEQAIGRYLDGDRDLELRQKQARKHARAAHEAARRVELGAAPPEERAVALREVGQALGLDPKNATAVRTLLRLLTEPPRELPPAAAAELEQRAQAQHRENSRLYGRAFLVGVFAVPIALWMGVRSWTALVLCGGLWMLAALHSYFLMGRKVPKSGISIVSVLLGTTAIAALAPLFGPWLGLPTIAAFNTVSYALGAERRYRRLFITLSSLAVAGPALLEWAGLLPPSLRFQDGGLVVLPRMLSFPPVPTVVMLCICTILPLLFASSLISRFREALAAAERGLFLQAWQLRQVVPSDGDADPFRLTPASAPAAAGACELWPFPAREAPGKR